MRFFVGQKDDVNGIKTMNDMKQIVENDNNFNVIESNLFKYTLYILIWIKYVYEIEFSGTQNQL